MVAKKDLEEIPWERMGVKLSTPARTIKMLRPVCPETISLDTGNAAPGCETKFTGAWWLKCIAKGHNPYFQAMEVQHKLPVIEEKDGRKFIVGYTEEVELVETPRTTQVPLGPRFNSGQLLEEKKFFHGYRYPHEMGFHDMCEFRNCYQAEPGIKTRYGLYCSEDEAKMITADARHMVLEVFIPEKRQEQIDAINIV